MLAKFLKFLLLLNISQAKSAKYDNRNYQELLLDVPIDHFSLTKSNETFKLRYLIVERFYLKGGPTFFYCGNEADITVFYENTGFLLDIAPTFNALVIFAEHRYYGQSMPYGASSLTSPEALRYLTTFQALADFVCVIDAVAKKYYDTMLTNDTYPIIAFGGSYGGMLAAWLRMMYPHVVLGAVASSAPLLQVNNLQLCEAFYDTVTRVYTNNDNCSHPLRGSWDILRDLTASDEGKREISEIFRLCKPLQSEEDVNSLVDSLANIYVNLATLNYPYSTRFLTPLPANPVKSFCDKLKGHGPAESSLDLMRAISSALEVATNYSGALKCNNIETNPSEPTDYAWNFQICFELIMPICSSSADMFEPTKWDYAKFSNECSKKYRVKPYSVEHVLLLHGGKMLKYASNIVFSNGLIDPWFSGGILRNVSESVVAILIPGAAHHHDLRGANPVDSKYVTDARKFHENQIRKWLNIP
ncbi:lysosomal Pro-X carboxypeptidase-like [Euwallacea fornicatus]|uniref:lysosomal Pro-X carboxypeptidase-like n=1 Tax=Euwallacea fornicatus TaxID=995702 RepID=UPI00338D5DB8